MNLVVALAGAHEPAGLALDRVGASSAVDCRRLPEVIEAMVGQQARFAVVVGCE